MSRNIAGGQVCDQCGRAAILLEEPPRLITKEEAGAYFEEYRASTFANAHCELCGAQYLAWCGRSWDDKSGSGFYDLSYRASFNDEPRPEDLPIWRVDQFGLRVGTINDPGCMPYFHADITGDDDWAESIRAGQAKWFARRSKEECREFLEYEQKGKKNDRSK